MRAGWICGLALLFLGLSACGPSRPNIDEAQFLTALHFNDPIAASVYFGSNIFDSSLNPQIAFFTKAGFINVLPNTRQAPWWNYNTNGGSLQGAQLTVPVATRVVTGHSDEKSWSEGSIDYFAETISYDLNIDPRIKPLLPADLQLSNWKTRLVLKNDPAVGQWQLAERGNDFNQLDQNAILTAISNNGPQYVGELTAAIQRAQTEASDQIERNLAREQVIARSASDPRVLEMKSAKVAFFAAFADFGPSTTIGALKAWCSGINVKGYSNWRIPSAAMLRNAFYAAEGPGNYLFVDTPDHRLWGAISSPARNGEVVYLTSSFRPSMFAPEQYDLYSPPDNVQISMITASFSGREYIAIGNHPLNLTRANDFDSTTLSLVAYNDMNDRRMICATSLN